MGYDSDHPRAEGEVGKVGVAIDSIEDMRLLLAGLPLDKVTTSMTINSTAAILLLLYELVAEEQGVAAADIGGGTIQNDLLKEYIARGTYIYPPRQSMRHHHRHLRLLQRAHPPLEHDLDLRLPHPRGRLDGRAGDRLHDRRTASPTSQAAIDAGLDVDEFAPRLSFFWNAHNNFFEEVAKFRAARRMWYRDHDRAVRRQEGGVEAAALPHADRRLHAHRAAAREQHRARRACRRWRR